MDEVDRLGVAVMVLNRRKPVDAEALAAVWATRYELSVVDAAIRKGLGAVCSVCASDEPVSEARKQAMIDDLHAAGMSDLLPPDEAQG